ncbi:Hypothetical protein GLP15_1641 [Giardia lamblia P15]|uniref:Uncharacterized protein n=1 Tax=Giardia intestinalis (strain P15) TaxID=658858 RepID=E1EX51_GIAIA|nr:Hypothetical protein GLP15_1641 [Giardia lamblia P15]
MSDSLPVCAYKTLGVPIGCEDDNLIDSTYHSSRKLPVSEHATPEERDAVVRTIFLRRLSYACICSSTRRSIYHQVSKLISDLSKDPVSAKVITAEPQISWTDDNVRANYWKIWAKTVVQGPVGFASINKARWFDPTILRGFLSYASVTITAKLTISITAHFYKANQTALSIETMRLEKVATSAGNAILLGSSQAGADMLKSSIGDISDTALEQLAPLAGLLRCSTGTNVPKKIEVKSSQQITSSALRDAFTDDTIMDLTASLIESAGAVIGTTEAEVIDSITKKYPGLTGLELSISNVDINASIPEHHMFSSEAGSVVVLQVPVAVQGYKWDQTLRYVLVNLLTGNMCGTAGVSRSKQGIGKFAALFKGKGKGRDKHKEPAHETSISGSVSKPDTTSSTQVEEQTPASPKPVSETATAPTVVSSAASPPQLKTISSPPPPAVVTPSKPPAPATPTAAVDASKPASDTKPAGTFFINKKILGPIDSDTSSSD